MMSLLNFVDLNLFVLDHIYKQLELEDQLKLATLHSKLSEAFAYHNHQRFKDIDVKDFLNSNYFPNILKLCGRNVCALHDYDSPKSLQMLQLAELYCPHLEEVTVHVTCGNIKDLEEVMLKLKTLKRIELRCNHRVPHINQLIESLQQLEMLQNVNLMSPELPLRLKSEAKAKTVYPEAEAEEERTQRIVV